MAQFILGNRLGKTAEKHQGLQKLLWRIDFAMVWLLTKLFALLPTDFSSRMGQRLGTLIGPRLKRKTEMYRENFRRAFPDASDSEIEALIVRSWGEAGRILGEYGHLHKIHASKDRERLHIETCELFDEYMAAGKPVIIATAHQSNWEISATAVSRAGQEYAALYSAPTNPFLNQLLLDSRRQLGCELVSKEVAARDMVRHIKAGRSAGLIVDRRIDGGPDVPFFGIPKPTSMLPAKLALKFNLPLFPVRVQRLRDAEFRVQMLEPIQSQATDENEQALDMMTQLHSLFEQWIREEPEHWFCSKRIWPKQAARKEEENNHAA